MANTTDIDFIRENDKTFSVAYCGKCILVICSKVVKTFDSLCDAMLYVDSTMDSDNYALGDYTGPEPKILYR